MEGNTKQTRAYEGVQPNAPEGGKARPASLLPDARREAAQIAAKQRWASLATKKVV